ncbi:MAG TPA: phosphatidylglycerophosphatase A [Chitinophagaceae bacterium]|nr:phosphatidylglycerophosphatase A [Chitinophagaceae bacterium]
MMLLAKLAATVFGIGYVKKGGGTIASIVYCVIWYLAPAFSNTKQTLILLAVLIIGVWSGNVVEKEWGKDSSRVVIDEVAGMAIALLFIPVNLFNTIAALLLFRFFDILKPLGIKKAERLNSGWGVMADDVLSGIYSLILLKTAIIMNLI